MSRLPAARWRAIQAALQRWGLLFAQDATLPSVTTIVAGEPVRGSWWPHPENGAIYDAFARLEGEGTFSARLLDGKWVYVHERLVPAVHAVALADEPWQTAGLSPDARALLARLEREGEFRTDEAPDAAARRRVAKAATELEQRLLADSRQVHTDEGHHTRWLRRWPRTPGRRLPAAAAARRVLDETIAALNAAHGGAVRAPWRSVARRARTVSGVARGRSRVPRTDADARRPR